MEAISNHAEEEVGRVVIFLFGFLFILWDMRNLVTPGHEISSSEFDYI